MEKQVKDTISFNHCISSEMYKVLKKATEKEQYKRYQTALEFKSALEQAINKPIPWWKKLFT